MDDDFDSEVPSEPCGEPLVPLLVDFELVFRRRKSLKKGIKAINAQGVCRSVG